MRERHSAVPGWLCIPMPTRYRPGCSALTSNRPNSSANAEVNPRLPVDTGTIATCTDFAGFPSAAITRPEILPSGWSAKPTQRQLRGRIIVLPSATHSSSCAYDSFRSEISNGVVDIVEKPRKTGPGFPPYRRRGPSDRATPPDFRASLGEWARKSGCAVFGMTRFSSWRRDVNKAI